VAVVRLIGKVRVALSLDKYLASLYEGGSIMATARRCFPIVVFLCAALLAGITYGQAGNYDVYQYSQPQANLVPVPDVDKVPLPPAVGDNSCWQATAANLLGAAGYGTGATPQVRATNIYNQMIGALGKANFGICDRAVNWWLYTYGKNPNSPDFMPTNAYTDVTVVDKSMTGGLTYGGVGNDYDFLLGELTRNSGQCVGVSFVNPDHCMTLVGGNWSNTLQATGNVCILHDSDRTQPDNVVVVNDDVYNNPAMPGVWALQNYNAGGGVTTAMAYTTLCPGLNKPEAAMRNYDVAYYMQALHANLALDDPAFRVAGVKGGQFGTPQWQDELTVQINNEVMPDMKKEVYLLVDYYDRVAGRKNNELVQLQATDPLSGQVLLLTPTSVESSTDDGQLLFTWLLDFQPASELLIFPDNRYSTLAGNVKDWDVSTICVPEPGTGMLLIAAGIGVLLTVWRRRRPA
jgi:hypothetical protein